MWQADPQPERSPMYWVALIACLPMVAVAWLIACPLSIAGALQAGEHLVAARLLGVSIDTVSAG